MDQRYGTPTAPDRPEFDLIVGDDSVGREVLRDVIEIDVDERVDRHGLAQVMLRNYNPDDRSMLHSDGPVFALGAPLEIKLGYRAELRTVFTGIVVAVTARFPASSVPVVVVEARTRSILLAGGPRPRSFEDLSAADQIAQIGDDYGLAADVEPSDTFESLFDHASDWDRVTTIARRYGWVAYVRDDTISVREPAPFGGPNDDPAIELRHGTNLVELSVSQDVRRLADPVDASLWDPKAVEPVQAQAAATDVPIETGDRPDLSAVLAATDLPMRGGFDFRPDRGTQAEVEATAAGRSRRMELGSITGTGLAIGLPDLRIDRWITLDGVGDRFSGPHYVSGVRHRLGGNGYNTEFRIGLPEPLEPPPTTGLIEPSIPSALRLAVVEDLDDPERWGRVKVRPVTAGAEAAAVWARVATVDAGPDAGTYFIPDIGDEVVVGFAGQDPIVVGSLWNGKAAPPETVDPSTNHVRTIRSRSGHVLRMVDGDDATVELQTGTGHRLVIDEAASSIELAVSNGNGVSIGDEGVTITAKQGDIVLTAAGGDVKVDGIGIEAKAKGPAKVESAATLDVTAKATLGLTGALININ